MPSLLPRNRRRDRSRCHARSAARCACALAALLLLLGCGRETRPRLLLLVTIDTLRADHLGSYGSPLGLTPALDELASQSLRFTTAYAPASYTLPSIATLMTGRYPEEVGIYENRAQFGASQLMLAEALGVNGWRSGAVVSNYVLRAGTGMEAGFDHYDDAFTHSEANRDQPERRGDATTQAALEMLESLESGSAGAAGVFLWVHYQDPHGPYEPPGDRRARYLESALAAEDGERVLAPGGMNPRGALPDYQVVDSEGRVGFYRAGYAGEVAYLDEQFGRFMQALGTSGWLDGAAVMVTADHGESLGENDYWFAHGEMLSDVLVRIPLLLRTPGTVPGVRKDVVAAVDLFTTLLSMAGLPNPPGYAGRDLLAPGASDRDSTAYMATLMGSAIKRQALVADGYKYTHSRVPGRGERIVVEVVDDESSRPIDEKTGRMLGARLAAFRSQLDIREPGARQKLSPHDLEMLRQLGYVDDGER